MSAGNLRKQASVGASWARVTATTDATTVKNAPALLHRVIVSNGDAEAQTVTLADGETAVIVVNVAAGTTVQFEAGIEIATSLIVTPSDANVDALVIYD